MPTCKHASCGVLERIPARLSSRSSGGRRDNVGHHSRCRVGCSLRPLGGHSAGWDAAHRLFPPWSRQEAGNERSHSKCSDGRDPRCLGGLGLSAAKSRAGGVAGFDEGWEAPWATVRALRGLLARSSQRPALVGLPAGGARASCSSGGVSKSV
jgi:hypothetical protein